MRGFDNSLRSKFINRFIIEGNEKRRKLFTELQVARNVNGIKERKKIAARFKANHLELDKEKGYRIFTPPDNINKYSDNIVNQALDIVNNNDVEKIRRNKKAQLLTGLLDKETLTLDSPFLKYALDEDLIKTISRYIGCVPILTDVDIWYSKATNLEFGNSQLFHCDWASMSQFKVFIYANEVGEDDGPLTLIPAKKSKEIRDSVNYKFSQYLKDDIVNQYTTEDDWVSFLGTKGSSMMVDTSRCFHFGSRVKNKDAYRVVGFFKYLAPTDFKFLSGIKGACAHLVDDSLSDLQKMTLTF